MSEDYTLKESFEKIGALPIPKLADKKGNIIDGLHREAIRAQVPTVQLDVRNPLQFHMVRLVVNKCRRNMTPDEIRQCLSSIAELSGWSPTEMIEHLPFSETWIYKYLPDKYKDPQKARAGHLGGKASAASRREAKASSAKEATAPIAESESEEEFAQRFTSTFKSHTAQLVEKDFPVIINHMSEEQNCEECRMDESCNALISLVQQLLNQLPACMQKKLDH